MYISVSTFIMYNTYDSLINSKIRKHNGFSCQLSTVSFLHLHTNLSMSVSKYQNNQELLYK